MKTLGIKMKSNAKISITQLTFHQLSHQILLSHLTNSNRTSILTLSFDLTDVVWWLADDMKQNPHQRKREREMSQKTILGFPLFCKIKNLIVFFFFFLCILFFNILFPHFYFFCFSHSSFSFSPFDFCLTFLFIFDLFLSYSKID